MRIEEGCEIVIDSLSGVPREVLLDWLLGPAIAILLHQRGLLVLHGSSVQCGGRAAVFLGDSGTGKSITALACCLNGGTMLSDDQAVIASLGGFPVVYPAFPRLKIHARFLRTLRWPVGDRETPAEPEGKDDWEARSSYCDRPTSLRRIYLLADSHSYGAEPVSAREAFVALVRNSWLAPLLAATETRERHFRQCAELAAAVSVRRLCRPRDPLRMAELAEFIANDLGARSS
jgi:hypothetical protein